MNLIDVLCKWMHIQKDELRKTIVQFLKFGMVGVSNTAVSMGIYYLFLWIDSDLYMLGSIVVTILSIANAFFWNDRFVFNSNNKQSTNVLVRLGKTYISYGGTSILTNALLFLEVSVFAVNKTVAPIINLIITIPLNFLINKFWTFR